MTLRLKPTRYIPYRKNDIIEMCLATGQWDGKQSEHFRKFSQLMQSVFHYEFHLIQEQLKDAYAPINPDADTREVKLTNLDNVPDFIDLMESLLDKANYEKVSDQDLQQALREESMLSLIHISEPTRQVLVSRMPSSA